MHGVPDTSNPPVAAEPTPAAAFALQFEAHYREFYDLLRAIITRKFRIPDQDAYGLVHEVFVAYLAQADHVLNIRPWLVAVACNVSRNYWRAQHRTESLQLDSEDRGSSNCQTLEDTYLERLLVQRALSAVPEKSLRILRMHYLEGYTAPEIAMALATSTRYAEKLIHQALRRVRDASRGLTP